MGDSQTATGSDFRKGISIDLIEDGESLSGRVDDKAVLLVRQGAEFYAVNAHCTHYGAPLNEGLITGTVIHCPWHHSSFSLKTGEALRTPALNPIGCWHTEIRDNKIYVTDKKHFSAESRKETENQNFLILGGGAAGTSAAVMLRRHGFAGNVHIVSEDESLPYDRPNLSKEYMAGNAPEEWIPLFHKAFYEKQKIDISLKTRAEKIDAHRKQVHLSDGRTLKFDQCLIATGGTPNRPDIPGIDQDHVFTLRSLKDSRRIIARANGAKTAVILGAGFIGLEVAASLRLKNIEVHIVAAEEMPLLKVVGIHVSSYLKKLHEEHGVHFHLGHHIEEIRERSVVLDDHESIDCDFVIIGAGIRPNIDLAEQAGCAIHEGVTVNEYLETSLPGIFAAGDIARWPDPHTHRSIRVEHWQVAERQGQIAALNMLGDQVKFQDVPFFWTEHYDLNLGYVGHSECFDRMEVLGNIEKKNFAVAFYEDQHLAAFLTVGQDLESLIIEDVLAYKDITHAQEILRQYKLRLQREHKEPPSYFEPAP